MITKVTSENKGLYKSLFERASLALGEEATFIDSLDKYFSRLQDLFIKNQDYSYLPLDEPTFDINADTRVITVPSDFKKNGISVKGDHYAEVLYFTIDRYYDTTDLFREPIKIMIQWEDPKGNQGVSFAVFKDIDIFRSEGKMLFGWALNNTITKTNGALKFSVRFYELQDNNLIFSLSTLTASAVINPGLDYQFENGELVNTITTFENDEQHLINRIHSSEYTEPGADTVVPAPTWIIDLPHTEGQSITVLTLKDLGEDGNADDEYVFHAQATSTQGAISYIWKFKPTGQSEQDVTNRTGDVYIRTSDTLFTNEKVYYHKQTVEGVTSYVTFNPTNGASVSDDPQTVYEKVTGLSVSHHDANSPSVTGEYWVIAKNRIGFASDSIESYHVLIPAPAELTVAVPTADENHVLLEDGAATLKAKGTTSQVGDTISYAWSLYVEENGEPVETSALQEETLERNTESAFVLEPVSELAQPKFDTTYKVKVKANRNGDSTPERTFKYRVTAPAQKPVVILSSNASSANDDHPATLTARVTNADDMAHDAFIYQWFQFSVESDEWNPADLANDASLGSAVESESNINTIDVTAGGHKYYCRVRTAVNGDQSEAWVPSSENDMVTISIR